MSCLRAAINNTCRKLSRHCRTDQGVAAMRVVGSARRCSACVCFRGQQNCAHLLLALSSDQTRGSVKRSARSCLQVHRCSEGQEVGSAASCSRAQRPHTRLHAVMHTRDHSDRGLFLAGCSECWAEDSRPIHAAPRSLYTEGPTCRGGW